MSSPAIVVESLSKKFRIGTGGGPAYHRLSEMLTALPRYAYDKLRSPRTISDPQNLSPEACHLKPSQDFWALKDVSFEVKQGDVIGIIGRNGAGKSTLLKILSRITEPTSGRFGVRGRVASLLEVGTGFHPELTGRENIYVSGVTLGMTRAEIKKRFDEIVEFSGVEKFLDTPVKHYSSGMQVRLGFAVAAHLESEILIVDEVLSVGDAPFQEKCIGAMTNVSKSGRTVLVVSHNMPTILQLCDSAVLLKAGVVEFADSAERCVSEYLSNGKANYQTLVRFAPSGHAIELHCAAIETDKSTNETFSGTADITESLCLRLSYCVNQELVGANIAITVYRNGSPVFTSFDTDSMPHLLQRRKRGYYTAAITLPPMWMKPGQYSIAIGAGTIGIGAFFHIENVIHFNVASESTDITSKGYHEDRVGVVIAPSSWSLHQSEPSHAVPK